MKKKLLLLCVMISSAFAMMADYSALTFTDNTGSKLSVSTANLVITISDGQLKAVGGEGSLEFTLTDLVSMEFTDDPNVAGVSAPGAEGGAVALYTLDGREAGRFSTIEQAQRQLEDGVYIVKLANGGTLKIYLKK